MRRFIASFFLFAYLFANTELHELVKISAFISHYAEHQKEDRDLTLFKFIKIHYFSGNPIDDDYAKDMQLPFKDTDCNNSGATHTLPFPEYFALNPGVVIESAGLPLYDQSALPLSHLADIWQPPKAC